MDTASMPSHVKQHSNHWIKTGLALLLLAAFAAVSGCNTPETRVDACQLPEGYNLDAAFVQTKTALTLNRQQCAPQFASYWHRLLSIAEGSPGNDNKRRFSDFLLSVSNEGIISDRQAQNLYNRYFNVKFVTLIGDYNICSQACPTRSSIMADMTQELSDKEQGLLTVSADRQSFARADRLLQETELLLQATCSSCGVQ